MKWVFPKAVLKVEHSVDLKAARRVGLRVVHLADSRAAYLAEQ